MFTASILRADKVMLCAWAGGGPVLGAVAWLLLGGAPAAGEQLASFRDQLSSARATRPTMAPIGAAYDTVARPLFALTTGKNAVPEVMLRLDGVAIEPGRTAALVSINGGEPVWLDQGKSSQGVTLVAVQHTGVHIETATGPRQIELTQGSSSSPASPDARAPASARPRLADIPPGVRLPPPPASAPAGP